MFGEEILKAIRKEVNRGAEAKAGIKDIFKALTNMLDKEVLADRTTIRRIKKMRRKKTTEKRPNLMEGGNLKALTSWIEKDSATLEKGLIRETFKGEKNTLKTGWLVAESLNLQCNE